MLYAGDILSDLSESSLFRDEFVLLYSNSINFNVSARSSLLQTQSKTII